MLRARLDARRKRYLPRCSRACRRAPPLPRLRHKSGCPGPRCGSAARYSYVKPRRVHAVSIEPSTMSCMQLSVSCRAWGTTATCGGCCGEPNIQFTTRELVACRVRPALDDGRTADLVHLGPRRAVEVLPKQAKALDQPLRHKTGIVWHWAGMVWHWARHGMALGRPLPHKTRPSTQADTMSCRLYAVRCTRTSAAGTAAVSQRDKLPNAGTCTHTCMRASMHTRTLGARGCPEVRLAWRRREWCGVAWRWAASDVPARQRCSLWLCDCARTAVLVVWRCPNATGDALVAAGPFPAASHTGLPANLRHYLLPARARAMRAHRCGCA